MKNLIVILMILVVSAGWAQTKSAGKAVPAKKPVPATKTSKPEVPLLKNATDSFCYALGLSMANFYREQGISDINGNLVIRAINDSKNKKTLLNEADVNNCIVGYMQKKRSEKSAGPRLAGEKFLAENSRKPGVITLPSGMQYQVIQEGSGPKPVATDKVKCHYTGTFIDGKVFESSYSSNQPVVFQVGGVIRGWTEALQLMNTGSKWRLFIPSSLGYGDMDNGPIPGGSTLIFDVELLEIVKE